MIVYMQMRQNLTPAKTSGKASPHHALCVNKRLQNIREVGEERGKRQLNMPEGRQPALSMKEQRIFHRLYTGA